MKRSLIIMVLLVIGALLAGCTSTTNVAPVSQGITPKFSAGDIISLPQGAYDKTGARIGGEIVGYEPGTDMYYIQGVFQYPGGQEWHKALGEESRNYVPRANVDNSPSTKIGWVSTGY